MCSGEEEEENKTFHVLLQEGLQERVNVVSVPLSSLNKLDGVATGPRPLRTVHRRAEPTVVKWEDMAVALA